MKKKIVLALLVMSMGTMSVTGCGSASGTDEQTTSQKEESSVISEDADAAENTDGSNDTDEEQVEISGDVDTSGSAAEDTAASDDTDVTGNGGDSTDDPAKDRENELNNFFLGEHVRSSDESSLTITDRGDGTFDIAINITRLCSMENGTGTFDDHKMYFTIEDPNGEEMSGMIYLDGDTNLAVKITDSTWELLPTDEVLDGFGK